MHHAVIDSSNRVAALVGNVRMAIRIRDALNDQQHPGERACVVVASPTPLALGEQIDPATMTTARARTAILNDATAHGHLRAICTFLGIR